MFRLSRPCYDKLHRCPGWAGGGMLYPRGESRCNGGHLNLLNASGTDHKRLLGWRFLRCDTCNVVTWPQVVRWLDWRWWRSWRPRRVGNWLWWHSALYRRAARRWNW